MYFDMKIITNKEYKKLKEIEKNCISYGQMIELFEFLRSSTKELGIKIKQLDKTVGWSTSPNTGKYEKNNQTKSN
jgi:hypothetical protein